MIYIQYDTILPYKDSMTLSCRRSMTMVSRTYCEVSTLAPAAIADILETETALKARLQVAAQPRPCPPDDSE